MDGQSTVLIELAFLNVLELSTRIIFEALPTYKFIIAKLSIRKLGSSSVLIMHHCNPEWLIHKSGTSFNPE